MTTINILVRGAALRGRPTSDSAKVGRAVQALAADGSPFQAAMLAAAILCVAGQHSDSADGNGFSKKTAKDGLKIASWVRGGELKRKFKVENFDSAKSGRYEVVSVGEVVNGMIEVTFRAVANVITPGYHTKRALGVVTAHLKQIGQLEVDGGHLTKAMAEVEATHGVAGLVETYNNALAVQERAKVERIEPVAVAKKAKGRVMTEVKV